MPNRIYKAIIIGCGSIGALKPDKYDSPKTANILTHAHAYHECVSTKLVGICDTDLDKMARAADKWGCVGYTSLEDSIIELEPDIVSVCVPTKSHYDTLKCCIVHPVYRPKIVIIEKPFCSTTKEAKEIVDIYKEADIALLVNYTRRYVPDMALLKHLLTVGPLNDVKHVRIMYGRGLRREASHAIDLMHYFFGDLKQVLEIKNTIHDYQEDDPSISVSLDFERCSDVQLVAMDSRDYSVFDIDIWTGKGRINLTKHGIHWDHYPIEQEKTYDDTKTLSNKVQRHDTILTQALFYLVSTAASYLNSQHPDMLTCTGEDALKVHKTFDAINKKFIKRGIEL